MTAWTQSYGRPAATPIARCHEVKESGNDVYMCTAAAGHEPLDHAAYGSNLDAPPLHTWPATAPGTIPAPRLHTCPDCGGHGTQPTHASTCHRLSASRIWSALAAADARIALARWTVAVEAVETMDLDAPPELWDAASRARRTAADALGGRLASLLAEIDIQAGAL